MLFSLLALATGACSDDDPSGPSRDGSASDAATRDGAPSDGTARDGSPADAPIGNDGAPGDASSDAARSDASPVTAAPLLLGAPDSITQACGVAAHPSGDLVVVGQTNGRLWGADPKGRRDLFVARVRPDGDRVWVQQIGDVGVALGIFTTGCAVTTGPAGEIYVAGTANGLGDFEGQPLPGVYTAFAARLEANGTRTWLRLIGESPGPTEAMAVDHHAGLLRVLGWTRAPLAGLPPAGQGDVFLMRLVDTTGVPAGTTRFGTEAEEVPMGLVRDDTGLWLGFRRYTAPLVGMLGHEIVHLNAQDAVNRTLKAGVEVGFTALDFAVAAPGRVVVLGQTTHDGLRGYAFREYLQNGTLGPTRPGSHGDGLQVRALSCVAGACAVAGQVIGALNDRDVPRGETISAFADLFTSDLTRTGTIVVDQAPLAIGAGLAARGGTWYLAGWSNAAVRGRPITGTVDAFVVSAGP
jgi:hypothetical protein